jgi:prepilin-type N-terminal cleavage/methylation domain-containing protein
MTRSLIRINSITSPERRGETTFGARQTKPRTSGFSLIELMVAMVLGLLVVAGLINLFVANHRAYQVQAGNNFLQENMRIASDRIGWSLRMADFWDGNKTVQVNSSASGAVSAKGNCTGAWATLVDASQTDGGAVHGYDGAATFPLGDTCIGDPANYVAGSDVLVVRYADPQTLSPGPADAGFAPAESSSISSNPKQVFVLSTPGSSAQLFAGTPPSTATIKVHRYVHPYEVDMYYLRPCSVLPSGGKCTATADNGLPLPTLMRLHLDSGGNLVSEPVVDGVEQINYEYGVANASNGMVPSYASASDVTSDNQWPNVVSVRVSLVAVNATRDIGMPHVMTYTLGTLGNCTYAINNGTTATTSGCHGFTVYGDRPWQFARLQQQFVVQLRNRLRGS